MPPYYNSPAASGHAPHPYMWGPPQAMMSPYRAPYAAIYSHGSVYAYPEVPLGSNGQGVPLSPAAANPSSIETPTKSYGNNDRGLVKRSKGFDALEMSIGNGNAENAEGGADQSISKRTLGFLFFFAILLVTTKVSAEELENVSKLETPGDQNTPSLPTDKIYGDQKSFFGPALKEGFKWVAKGAAKEAGSQAGEGIIDSIGSWFSGDDAAHSP